jgi:sec-independent protein translocase protein TatA
MAPITGYINAMNAILIGGLGPGELVLILLIVLIIFGAGKLPQIGDALGKGIKNFKSSASGKDEIDVTPPAPAQAELPPAAPATPVVEAQEVAEPAKKTPDSSD